MQRDERDAYLRDALLYAQRILDYTRDQSFAAYEPTAMLRDAVERNFDLISEALKHAERVDPSLLRRITNLADIKGIHTKLIHQYRTIDNEILWSAAEQDIPILHAEILDLLNT